MKAVYDKSVGVLFNKGFQNAWHEHNICILPDNPSEHLDILDEFSKNGWELVCVCQPKESAHPLAYFRRPAPIRNADED